MYNKIDSFGKRLQDRRKDRGYTQKTFANDLDVSIKSVMNWEQNIVYPDSVFLPRIADLLECDLDYLFMRIDEKTHDKHYICQETGLSEGAVEYLLAHAKDYHKPNSVLSLLLEHPLFLQVIGSVYDYYSVYANYQRGKAVHDRDMKQLDKTDDWAEQKKIINSMQITSDDLQNLRLRANGFRDSVSDSYMRMIDLIMDTQYKKNSK